jgi:hypothetical protein
MEVLDRCLEFFGFMHKGMIESALYEDWNLQIPTVYW